MLMIYPVLLSLGNVKNVLDFPIKKYSRFVFISNIKIHEFKTLNFSNQ